MKRGQVVTTKKKKKPAAQPPKFFIREHGSNEPVQVRREGKRGEGEGAQIEEIAEGWVVEGWSKARQ